MMHDKLQIGSAISTNKIFQNWVYRNAPILMSLQSNFSNFMVMNSISSRMSYVHIWECPWNERHLSHRESKSFLLKRKFKVQRL